MNPTWIQCIHATADDDDLVFTARQWRHQRKQMFLAGHVPFCQAPVILVLLPVRHHQWEQWMISYMIVSWSEKKQRTEQKSYWNNVPSLQWWEAGSLLAVPVVPFLSSELSESLTPHVVWQEEVCRATFTLRSPHSGIMNCSLCTCKVCSHTFLRCCWGQGC